MQLKVDALSLCFCIDRHIFQSENEEPIMAETEKTAETKVGRNRYIGYAGGRGLRS